MKRGEYSVSDLAAGPWLAAAAAPASWNPPEPADDRRLGWAQTFYPGVTDPHLAEAVMVGPGSESWNLDIKLAAAPVHRVRGRLIGVSGEPIPKTPVALGKAFGPDLTSDTGSDGTFEFAAVVEDEWRLSAAVAQGGVKLRGVQLVELNGHDSDKNELRLAAPFTLRGKVVMDVPQGSQAPHPPPIDLVLRSGMALPPGWNGDIPAHWDEGNLTLRDVYPGQYRVETLTDSPAPYYLDSIRLGDQDANATVTILSDAQPLTVTYKLGGGTVRGTVEGCGAGHVLLLPQDPALRRHAFLYVATCGENGRFEITAVRPGEYYGIAQAGRPSADILQDGALLRQASRVSVNANEATTADIRLIAR